MANIQKVFICYETTTGLSYAKHLKLSLEKMKMPSFVAAIDLKAGDTNEDVIRENAIKECKYFVVVVTLSALESEEVKKEISMAGKYNKKIIPCKHKTVVRALLSKLPIIIESKLQQIDFEDKEELANYVISEISKIEKSSETIESESVSTTENHIRDRTYIEQNYVITHTTDLKTMLQSWQQRLPGIEVAEDTGNPNKFHEFNISFIKEIEDQYLFKVRDIFHHCSKLEGAWNGFKTCIFKYRSEKRNLFDLIKEQVKQKLKSQNLNIEFEIMEGFYVSIYRESVIEVQGEISHCDYFYDHSQTPQLKYCLKANGGSDFSETCYTLAEIQHNLAEIQIQEKQEVVENIHIKLIKECKCQYSDKIHGIIKMESEIAKNKEKLDRVLEENINLPEFPRMDCKFVKSKKKER